MTYASEIVGDHMGSVLGWDSSHYVSPRFAQWMKSKGFGYVIRYLRRRDKVDDDPREKWPVYLSRSELAGLLDAGLMVGLTQVFWGWDMLTAEHGYRAGAAMASNAAGIGAPKDLTLWCDGEWSGKRAEEADEVGYLDGWSQAVRDAGFTSIGLYVGSNTGLTGRELYKRPRFTRYWKSLSRVPAPHPRGFCMWQSWERVIKGTRPETWSLEPWDGEKTSRQRIDLDFSDRDYHRGRWRAMVAGP